MIKASDFSAVLLFYSRDVFYYTGTAQPCYLFVSPQTYCLFVRAGSDLALREAQIEKKNMKEERQLGNIFKEISCTISSEGRIGAELDARNVKVIAPSHLISPNVLSLSCGILFPNSCIPAH